MFFSCREFDKNCQDCRAYTLLTAACITKSKPSLPEYKRSFLFVSTSFFLCSLCISSLLPLLFLDFSPAWVSRWARSHSWPQIRSVYIISPLPVEIHTSDIFSIQYPEAMFCCLINQITVTQKLKMHWDLKRQTHDILLSVCMLTQMCVCVHVPKVKDHLLILVQRENLFYQEEMNSDWTATWVHIQRPLQDLSTHTPQTHIANTSQYSFCSCLIADDWFGVRKKEKELKDRGLQRERRERLLQLIMLV